MTRGAIRRAALSDVPGIQAVLRANPDTILARSDKEIAELIESFWVVQEPSGEISGCCCLEVYSPKIAEVRSVAVKHEYRGRGYGKVLVEAAVSAAKELHIHEILVVTSSPKFFERLNFGPCLNEKFALFYIGDKPEE